MSSADAKKFLTEEEQQVRNKLLETVKAGIIGKPETYQFEFNSTKTKTIANKDIDCSQNSDEIFETMTLTSSEMLSVIGLTNTGYGIQVRIESGVLSVVANKSEFDDVKFYAAIARYDELQAKKKEAEISLQHWNNVIAQRKKEYEEPELPSDVAELQEMIRQMRKK